jgi:hypothetical protein
MTDTTTVLLSATARGAASDAFLNWQFVSHAVCLFSQPTTSAPETNGTPDNRPLPGHHIQRGSLHLQAYHTASVHVHAGITACLREIAILKKEEGAKGKEDALKAKASREKRATSKKRSRASLESSGPLASSSTVPLDDEELTHEKLRKRLRKVGAELGRKKAEYRKLKNLEAVFGSD